MGAVAGGGLRGFLRGNSVCTIDAGDYFFFVGGIVICPPLKKEPSLRSNLGTTLGHHHRACRCANNSGYA
jgi:hypothetical protein